MNAKHLMTGAIVGALALAGCMSLEERLASNDAQVRREAEYELVSQARKSGKVDECVAAVGRVSDQQLLLGVAQSSPNGYEKEGVAAVGKISDEANLLTISKTAKSEKVAVAAIGKLAKQESLLDVARCAQFQAARLAAYMRMSDQDQMLQVAMASQDAKIKLAAIDKVTDMEKLLPLIFAPQRTTTSSPVRAAQRSAQKGDAKVKMTLMKQKMAQSLDHKKHIASVEDERTEATDAVSVNAELVDAFISKCTNDDVFLKLVKGHGAQLTDAQCAVIKGKTKNQSLLKMIDSVGDLKIAARAKASKDPKKYSEFLDAIHNDDIRHDLCVALLLRLNFLHEEMGRTSRRDLFRKKYGDDLCDFVVSISSVYNYHSAEDKAVIGQLARNLRDDEVESILFYKKLDDKLFEEKMAESLSSMIAESLTPEKRMVVFRKMLELKDWPMNSDANLRMYIREDISKGRIKVLDVIKGLDGRNIGRFGGGERSLPYAVCKAIKSSEEAEMFLASDFMMVPDESDLEKLMDAMLANVVPLVGEQERVKGVALAKKHFAERKQSEFSFGPYYVGMPIYEARLLSVNDGIPKGVTFGYDREELKNVAKDWKTSLKVTSISFTRKGALKYLDCEDSTILQQTIKQYVKKEKGRANSYDYASDIRHDLDISTSRSIDIFSPTGTKLNVDSEIWRVYTNTKMGIRIEYAEKSGALVISELAE